ncbi:Fic family protein [Elstera sp.]|jgi:Fic family protein|uniref:Fic family protein n=1 Tax=Elstera sp. TaxID=1916664 RepID=UPI0037BEF4F3
MIFDSPALEALDHEVLGLIQAQRQLLRHHVGQNPTRWRGFIRKNTFARALQGSNSIEGYTANLTEAVAIIDEERPETLEEETLKALQGYRTAMAYIMAVHDDPYTQITLELIRSLHYMMLSYDLTKLPGQWRPNPIYVLDEVAQEIVYEGPEAAAVPALMEALVRQINETRADSPPIVQAAMAHLNLAMIHPFKDGNGRMARALQTLIISRNDASSPVFSSIEEWLGRNTPAYYALLKEVGEGRWSPQNSALPWVRFCLRAHYQQAATLLRRNAHMGQVWARVSQLVAAHKLPERTESALVEAAFGYTLRNHRYRVENEISDVVASRDLKRLCDLDLLIPKGEKRGRTYVAAPALRALWSDTLHRRRSDDPYALAREKQTPLLF